MIGSHVTSWTEQVLSGRFSWSEPVFPAHSGLAGEQLGALPQLQFLIGLKNSSDATTPAGHNVFRHEIR
jgi:hypothetical protein